MAVNPEYIRLNRFKRSDYHWVVEAPEKSVPKTDPFAEDFSFNILSKGVVADYEAINASISMIVLSTAGDHIFRPWLASVAQTTPFEPFSKVRATFPDDLKSDIERLEKRIKIIDLNTAVSEDAHELELRIRYVVVAGGGVGEYSQKLAM